MVGRGIIKDNIIYLKVLYLLVGLRHEILQRGLLIVIGDEDDAAAHNTNEK